MKKSTKQVIRKRIASIMLSAVLAVTGAGLLPQFALPVQAVAPTQYDISSDSVDLNISSDSTIEITGSTDMHYVTIDVAAGKKRYC